MPCISTKNFLKSDLEGNNLMTESEYINILKELAQKESVIYFNNKFPLFRGSKDIDKIILQESDQISKMNISDIKDPMSPYNLYTMSFANSTFGGFFYDNGERGACFWSYARMPETKITYILSLDKKEALSEDSIYYISTQPISLSLVSEGELFHSRTKLPINSLFNQLEQIKKISSNETFPEKEEIWSNIRGLFIEKSFKNYELYHPITIKEKNKEFIDRIFLNDYKNAHFIKISSNRKWEFNAKDKNSIKKIEERILFGN